MAFIPKPSLLDEITDFLATGPHPSDIIAYQPSDALNARLHALLDKNAEASISPDEREELDDFVRLDELLSLLKVKARLHLNAINLTP